MLPYLRERKRIPLHQRIETTEGDAVTVADFNYQYITLEGTEERDVLSLDGLKAEKRHSPQAMPFPEYSLDIV